MVLFNYSTKELTAKVVYYGPGLCGKTTNLQYIYTHTSNDSRGERYPTRHLLQKSSAIHVLFLRSGDGNSASARVAIRESQNTAPPIMTRGSTMSMPLIAL